MGIVETGGIKENQAVSFELRITRNGVDEYRERMFSTRGCAVPDSRDNLTDSNVNELETRKCMNGRIVVAL